MPKLKYNGLIIRKKTDVDPHIFQQGEQPMRFRILAFTATIVMLLAAATFTCASEDKASTGQASSAVAAIEKPGVMLPELKYEFDPVVDGSQITHDFAIKNTGNGPLAITQVKTG